MPPTLPDHNAISLAEAQTHCAALTKRSGSNFYYSFLFLPRERRDAMYTVYAFCREIDSAVDDPPPGSDPADALALWRTELAAAYHGTPTRAVTVSLAAHARRLDIPSSYFEELIRGVEMDLSIRRYATFDDLFPYCYRVASVVGLICLKIFGTRSPLAVEYAVNLGLAFQMTNILRDLGSDAARDRVYLPQEDLTRFSYSEQDLMRHRQTPEFVQLMKFECGRTRGFYEKARELVRAMPAEDRRALTVAEIMRGVYSRILDRIEDSGYQVFGPRVRLSSSHRMAIAAGVWLKARLAGT